MSLEERHREEGQRSRRPRDHGGSDQRDATASHGWQPATGGRRGHGRTGAQPGPRLDVELPASCCILAALGRRVRGRVLQRPQETDTGVSGREAG